MASERFNIVLCNQNWFADELRQAGHNVLSIGDRKRGFDLDYTKGGLSAEDLLEILPRAFQPDLLIYYDDSYPPWITGCYRFSFPTMFYSVDAHHHCVWHRQFARQFDHVYVAQKDYLKNFREVHQSASWFPLWAPLDLEPQSNRDIDVCFRGTLDPALHPERVKFLDEVKKHIALDCAQGPYADVFTRSKIILNQAVKNDFNFRVFEGMMGGGLLLTPRIENGLLELFTSGQDLVTYESNDVQDAVGKIRYYLEHDSEREAIAARGFQKVKELHSKQARAESIIERLRTLKVSRRQGKYFGSGYSCVFAGLACGVHARTLAEMHFALARNDLIESFRCEVLELGEQEQLLHSLRHALEDKGHHEEAVSLLRAVRDLRPYDLLYNTWLMESLSKSKEATPA